jgi:predicted DNA-binding protein
MRPVFHTTIVLLVLVLSACEMKTPRAKTPPPPQPDSAKAEPTPESTPAEPLSIPQTQVRLPSPQPIDPEALATPPVYVPAEQSQTSKTRRGSKRQGPQPAAAPSPGKPETVETVDPPPAAETPRPPIGPVLSDEERRRMTDDINARLKNVDQLLGRIAALHLTEAEKASVERIRSFQKLSHEAQEHGEIQQASTLADRAVLLAQEVLSGR